MSNAEQQLNQIEVSLDQARKVMGTRKSLEKLLDNKDFQDVIEKGYFEAEASRLVLLKADDNMQETEQQNSIDRQISAVGTFRQYIRTTMQLGAMAERAIKDNEEARDEILGEDLDNG